MNTIQETLNWIEDRISNYLPLLTRIVYISTKSEEQKERSRFLLDNALKWAFFMDFHSETENTDYLNEAKRYNAIIFDNVDQHTGKDLKDIEHKIVKLFDYERRIWQKVQKGDPVSDEEIMKYWEMKSGDALFYGRIVNIFTEGKDFILPLHTYTQALDIVLDIREYEEDRKTNEPNIVYMKLAQKIPLDEITDSKDDVLKKARDLGVDLEIYRNLGEITSRVIDYDFSGYDFLKGMIDHRCMECKVELGLNYLEI